MSKNNDVFQVLVTSGDQAVLPAGGAPGTLGVGQIGVFDTKTGLSIDGSSFVRDFYLAVGLDRDGDAVLDDIKTSGGASIQTNGVRTYNYRPHTFSQPEIVEVTDYTGSCDTSYGLKVEFRNGQILRTNGHVPHTMTYTIKTDCCEGCEDCPTGDANDITSKMVNNINAQDGGFLTAEAIARDTITAATHGTSVDYAIGAVMTDADVLALIVWNALPAQVADPTLKVFSNIRLTSVGLGVPTYAGINTGYYKQRETNIIVGLASGFDCNGTVTKTQELAYEEGKGYDIQYKEYIAGGWNGKSGPYRVNTVTGLAKNNIEYFASLSEEYDQIAIEYDNKSTGGWGEFESNIATIVAVPETNTTTRGGLVAVLDALLGPLGFEDKAGAATAASVSPTVVENVDDIDDVTLDGLD